VITKVTRENSAEIPAGFISAVLRKRNASIKKCHKNAKINFTKAQEKIRQLYLREVFYRYGPIGSICKTVVFFCY